MQFNSLITSEPKSNAHISFGICKQQQHPEMSADSELSSILNRRQQINDALENGEEVKHTIVHRPGNIYTEFHEFSRKEIKDYQSTFNK